MTDVISTAIISDGRIHFQDQLQKSFLLLHLGRGWPSNAGKSGQGMHLILSNRSRPALGIREQMLLFLSLVNLHPEREKTALGRQLRILDTPHSWSWIKATRRFKLPSTALIHNKVSVNEDQKKGNKCRHKFYLDSINSEFPGRFCFSVEFQPLEGLCTSTQVDHTLARSNLAKCVYASLLIS